MALLYVTKVHIKLSATRQDQKFNLVEARKTILTMYNMVQKYYKTKIWDFYYHWPLWQVIFFVIIISFLFFLALYIFFLHISFLGAPNVCFFSFRPLYPIKNIQLQQLKRMAITPLYGSHITIVSGGPRGLEPHAHRIICGPFGLTPGTPNQHR